MTSSALQATVAAELGDQCESLYRLISFTARDLRRALGAELRRCGLTGAQFGVLLGAASGGASIGDIAEDLLSDPTSIGRVIERLESQGLVERFREPPDRRVIRVRLQPKGERLLEQVLPVHVAVTREILGFLEPHDRARLVAVLTDVRDQVTERMSSRESL